MENETKAKIFAQYSPKKFLLINEETYFNYVDMQSFRINRAQYRIELCLIPVKPLSAITDEDAIQVARMQNNSPELFKLVKVDIANPDNLWVLKANTYQYLQECGYALPATVIENGKVVTYTVEQLVKMGVYKLIE